jgi:diguanylate cyclase (GGDEF)-like protein
MMDIEQKNSILIVDDETTNLMVLTHILGSEYIILTAKDGANAIEKATEYIPDLILLDIIMPEMNGYDVLAALKESDKTRKIPVIFITGLSSSEDEEKGLSLEAADYISKPFKAQIVRLRVKNQIQIINQLRTIERLSMIDQLTGMFNRRSFDDRLGVEWKQAIRQNQPISILIVDIDKFKKYNDTYGHQQGDVVLQTVSSILLQSLKRPTDFAARWGGEEFVVLLPGTDSDGAMEVAEKIRLNVEKERISIVDGSTTKVTISIGMNTQFPDQGSSSDLFFSNADKALYKAKDLGRNRVYAVDADINSNSK